MWENDCVLYLFPSISLPLCVHRTLVIYWFRWLCWIVGWKEIKSCHCLHCDSLLIIRANNMYTRHTSCEVHILIQLRRGPRSNLNERWNTSTTFIPTITMDGRELQNFFFKELPSRKLTVYYSNCNCIWLIEQIFSTICQYYVFLFFFLNSYVGLMWNIKTHTHAHPIQAAVHQTIQCILMSIKDTFNRVFCVYYFFSF